MSDEMAASTKNGTLKSLTESFRISFEAQQDASSQTAKVANHIFERNREAGWWTNLNTGECIVETRDRLQTIMLVVTELAEAWEGLQLGTMDDKLPQYPQFGVELADAAIRLFDLIGAEIACHEVTLPQIDPRDLVFLNPNQAGLWQITYHLARAAEAGRKNKHQVMVNELYTALLNIFLLAQPHPGSNRIYEMIWQKVAFNSVRPDHKAENRKADDGKKV